MTARYGCYCGADGVAQDQATALAWARRHIAWHQENGSQQREPKVVPAVLLPEDQPLPAGLALEAS